jgi:hypothetical protein
MTWGRVAFATLCVIASLSGDTSGEDFAKPKLLPPREEERWVDAVKNHVTTDGATVLQVLQYTEKMRPDKFKFAFSGVGYNGATGEPDGVPISYWIGAKRLKDDYYVDLGYDIERDGQNIKVIVPKNPYDTETTVHALEGGRNSFLLYIDKTYDDICIDAETKTKLC